LSPGVKLEQVASRLNERGYAIVDGHSRADAESLARQLGVVQGTWERLVARDVNDAGPWSLSGVFGRSAFPWHTDGAVASVPPRYVVMRYEGLEPVEGTHLLDCTVEGGFLLRLAGRMALRITNARGYVRYVPALSDESGRSLMRWDPRVATPLPSKPAAEMEAALASLAPTETVKWIPSRTLFFRNDTLLHARPAVPPAQSRTLQRLYIY
jgi:alpha-ketoglutarate-dependent taurine dioxygenase